MQRIDQYVPEGYQPKWWHHASPRRIEVHNGPPSAAVVSSSYILPGFAHAVHLYHPTEFYIIASCPEGRREEVLDAIARQLDRVVENMLGKRKLGGDNCVVGVTHRYHHELREAVTNALPEDMHHEGPYLGGRFSTMVFDAPPEDVRFALQPNCIVDPARVHELQLDRG